MEGNSPIGDIFSRVKYLNECTGIRDLHEIVTPQYAKAISPGTSYTTRRGILYKKHYYSIRQHLTNQGLVKKDPYYFKVRQVKGMKFGNSPNSRKHGFQILNYNRKPLLDIEMRTRLGYNALRRYFHSIKIQHPFDIGRFMK